MSVCLRASARIVAKELLLAELGLPRAVGDQNFSSMYAIDVGRELFEYYVLTLKGRDVNS